MNRSLNIACTSLLAVLAVSACAKSREQRERERATAPAAMPAPAPAPAPAPVTPQPTPSMPSAMQLTPKNNSGVTGEVTESRTNSNAVIAITLHGLKNGETYPAHIHKGSCATEGPVEVKLNSISASNMNGHSSSTVPVSKIPSPAFVQVHDHSNKPVACVDMMPSAGAPSGATSGTMTPPTTSGY